MCGARAEQVGDYRITDQYVRCQANRSCVCGMECYLHGVRQELIQVMKLPEQVMIQIYEHKEDKGKCIDM